MSRDYIKLKKIILKAHGIELPELEFYVTSRAGRHQRAKGQARWSAYFDGTQEPLFFKGNWYTGVVSQYTLKVLIDAHCLSFGTDTFSGDLTIDPCDHPSCKHYGATYKGHDPKSKRNFWNCPECTKTLSKLKGWKPPKKTITKNISDFF